MKKLLLCFLLCLTVVSYSSSGVDRPGILKSYFKKFKSIASNAKTEKLVYIYPKGTICRGYINFVATTPMLWSSNSSWASFGATKPVAGSAVTIPAGVHMILDESPPNLASLSISGKLEFAGRDISLTAGWIMVMGTLQVGTPTMPYVHKALITLNGTNPNEEIMGMRATRGIMVMGGKLELHGVPPTKHYTKLNNHAAAGATALTLHDPVSWNVNDQIVVATTDYYGAGNGSAQRTQITTMNGKSVTIQDGLNAYRWGILQYLTKNGMSLTPGELPADILDGTPTELDERAEVANLTRNIVVQSVDDDLWQNGFGCHIMIMRMDGMVGEAHLNGIEIRRGGQAGKLGRYPFHWHMLSYEGSTTLPDVTGQYIRNSTINQSAQRGIVIHGTNGAEVKNNVVYDVRGHGIFTEDASERRNIIDGNLVMKVRNSLDVNALKLHETWRGGSSGFWISNPDNTIINNTASDCEGVGFWLAFPERTFGESRGIALVPTLMAFGTFSNNHAHSNSQEGIMLDKVETNEEGNTGGKTYYPTIDMKEPGYPFDTFSPFELVDYSVWKNNSHGIWDRAAVPRNRRVVNADNNDRYFAGAGHTPAPGLIETSLVVGRSLNTNMNGTPEPTHDTYGRSAFASYHSTFDMKNNVVVNFPAEPGKPSGFFALSDYYISPVDKGNVRNTDNILINSHPGVRTLPTYPQHVFGVVWDHHNYLGGPASQDNYYVFDRPFFTYGQTPHIVPQSSREVSGGVVASGPFYGFTSYTINNIKRDWDKIVVTRTNATGAVVDNWVVEAGQYGDILGVMRHFAAHPTGYYYLDFPTIDDVNQFDMVVTNMLTADDYQVMSVEYSGDYTITELFTKAPGLPEHNYTAVSDFQAVVNAPHGEVYWQDKTNNKVWIKIRGGVNPGDLTLAADHDFNLYKEFSMQAKGIYTSTRPAYTVSFTVKDAGGTLLPGATVEFRGNRAVSNASGVATFTNVPPGTNLLYIATKDGHNNATGTLNVTTANVAQNVVLTVTGSPTYTVTFTVKDASGTLQTYTGVSFNGHNITTTSDGLAVFRNVAPGTNLPYSASKMSVGQASGSVNVSANLEHTIVLVVGTRLFAELTPERGITFNKIYPNPTKDIITIEYNAGNSEGLDFIISDIFGRQLNNIKTNSIIGKNLQNLNFDTFPNGVYFVTIKNGNDSITTRKVIKN